MLYKFGPQDIMSVHMTLADLRPQRRCTRRHLVCRQLEEKGKHHTNSEESRHASL